MRPTFNPRILLGYRFPNNQQLRWELETKNHIPEIGHTTEVVQRARENYYERNNPQLKNAYSGTTRLYYTNGNDYFDISNTVMYDYIHDVWAFTYTKTFWEGREVIMEQRINIPNEQKLMLHTVLSFQTFREQYAHL
ncbi:MAG: hypothetical protein ACFNLL_03530 [Bacteroides sp.]